VISGNKVAQIAVRTFCTGNIAVFQPIATVVRAKICKKVQVPARVNNAS